MHEPTPSPQWLMCFPVNKLSLFPIEIPVANEGNLCWVSEDCVPHGKALCQPAGVSHQLLPLFLLQQQTQVCALLPWLENWEVNFPVTAEEGAAQA